MIQNVPEILFAEARGARLAYQAWGDGPATIVAIPPLAQNIEVAWEWPQLRTMFDRFGSFCRYVHFDKRGTGASDRNSEIAGLDERVDDVRAVMDAAEVKRAHFFVQSDGGPVAMMFALTYPKRVESLVLVGTGATLNLPWPEDERIVRRERQVAEWGTPDSRIVDFFAPSMAANQSFRTWHQRYERRAASADGLRVLLDMAAETDVTEILPDLNVPTLVVHRTGDRIVPVDLGRHLAKTIKGARLIELEGDDHFAFVGDLNSWIPEVERFVTGSVAQRNETSDAPQSVHVVTLGRFGVERDGIDVPTSEWGSRLARDLCKRLVAARGWPVTREELIDILWPDESDMKRLSARLSVQLSAVRRVLDGGVIADREVVRLDLDAVSTDLDDFHRATDDAAIVASYTGEFLPENRYDDWSRAAREKARTRFVAAVRRRAAREADMGNAVAAATLLRKIAEIEPYDEATHRSIVELLISAGETAEARHSHETWAASMAELDIDVPSFDQLLES